MVPAILGVLTAGAAYLPLDPDHPAHRLEFMLDDAAPVCLLTTTALADRLPSAPGVERLLLDGQLPAPQNEPSRVRTPHRPPPTRSTPPAPPAAPRASSALTGA